MRNNGKGGGGNAHDRAVERREKSGTRKESHHLSEAISMLLRALWTWTSIWAITGTVFLGVWSVMLGQNDFKSGVWAVGIALTLLVAKGMLWVQEHHIPSKQKRSARLLIAVVACAIFVLHCFYIQGK